MMRRFVEEADRGQWTLLPECLDDFIDESNPVRVIDVFVEALDLAEMSFEGAEPAAGTRSRTQCRGDVVAGPART
jgi:transposase